MGNVGFLFLSYPQQSGGDFTVVTRFADELLKNGIQSYLFVSIQIKENYYKYPIITLSNKWIENWNLIYNTVMENSIKIFFITGLPNPENMNEQYHFFLDYISKNLQIPIVIFSYDIPPDNYFSFYKFKQYYNQHAKFIFPVPHATPKYIDDSIFYWRIYSGNIQISESSKLNTKKKN